MPRLSSCWRNCAGTWLTLAATRPPPACRHCAQACAAWVTRRYGLKEGSLDPATMLLPVNGTREALFSFVQACIDASRQRRW